MGMSPRDNCKDQGELRGRKHQSKGSILALVCAAVVGGLCEATLAVPSVPSSALGRLQGAEGVHVAPLHLSSSAWGGLARASPPHQGSGRFGEQRGTLRLRGGMGFLCIGGEGSDGQDARSFMRTLSAESMAGQHGGGGILKEGWILRRSMIGPCPFWRRVYASVGSDSFLTYFPEARHALIQQSDGSVPLQACTATIERPALGISGACLSLGNVLRVRIGPLGRSQGGTWWFGDFVFAALGEGEEEEWLAAITAASATPFSFSMLKDLDPKVHFPALCSAAPLVS